MGFLRELSVDTDFKSSANGVKLDLGRKRLVCGIRMRDYEAARPAPWQP
jgi:hypothetical protein